MKIQILNHDECDKAEGLCVVIDVLRAFTTAAFALDGGVEEIFLVATTEEAFEKYRHDNQLILMGESEGKQIQGFHYGNSPAEIQDATLYGRKVVQRTSAGTQAVTRCKKVEQLLIASFVVATATLQHIQEQKPSVVSFIVSGTKNGDEDRALAEYLEARLLGREIDVNDFLERARHSPAGKLFADPTLPEFSSDDLELSLQLDRFSFAMQVHRFDGELVARKWNFR